MLHVGSSNVEDAEDKCHSGIHIKMAMPSISNLVSVDMAALESGRLCRPGQYSVGGELITALPSMAMLDQYL